MIIVTAVASTTWVIATAAAIVIAAVVIAVAIAATAAALRVGRSIGIFAALWFAFA